MSASMALALGALALLAVLVGYAVPALIQVRRTAKAAEDLMRGVTPRMEGATTHLESVLGRVDRVLKEVEEGTRGVTLAIGDVSAFLGRLKPKGAGGEAPSGWLGTLTSLLSGFWKAWGGMQASGQAGAPGGGNARE